MNMIDQVKSTIELNKNELSVKRRIAQAEFDKELEILMKADKWINLIEEDIERRMNND